MKKVSVVIPVFNGVKYIAECIDSVISQTLKEIEIIIVDAGSTDGTLEVLRDYERGDDRIKLLHSDKKSMGYQTNLGIQASSGEYVGFCEADDYVAPAMYERLYELAKGNILDFIKSDFDMFIGGRGDRLFLNYRILDSPKRKLYGEIIRPADHPDILYRDINMWNGIYNRRFIQANDIRLNETPKAAFQDVGFILQTFLLADRIMYVHEDANRYRRDNINSSAYDQRSLLFIVQEYEYMYQFLTERRLADKRIQTVIFSRFLSLFCGFYRRLPEWEEATEETKAGVEKFKRILKRFYKDLSYEELAYGNLNASIELALLLDDHDIFDSYEREMEKIRKKNTSVFFKYVKKYKKAVIFGAGERGTSCYGLLKKNDYEGVICFCDNDSSLWHKNIMGLEIMPPDGVLKDDVLFIVANVNYWKEIYDQLIAMGIKLQNICRAIEIDPHNALEFSLQEEKRDGKDNTNCDNNR